MRLVTDRNGIVTERVNGTAQSFSRELHGRLQIAEAMVRYLTSADAGTGGELLRERMLAGDTFGGVLLVPLKVSAPRAQRNRIASTPWRPRPRRAAQARGRPEPAGGGGAGGGPRRDLPGAHGQRRSLAADGAVRVRSGLVVAGRRGSGESGFDGRGRCGRTHRVRGQRAAPGAVATVRRSAGGEHAQGRQCCATGSRTAPPGAAPWCGWTCSPRASVEPHGTSWSMASSCGPVRRRCPSSMTCYRCCCWARSPSASPPGTCPAAGSRC